MNLESHIAQIVNDAVAVAFSRAASAHAADDRTLPLLMRQKDAAIELACSPRHVEDLINQGLLQVVVEGGRRKVLGTSVRAYVESLPTRTR